MYCLCEGEGSPLRRIIVLFKSHTYTIYGSTFNLNDCLHIFSLDLIWETKEQELRHFYLKSVVGGKTDTTVIVLFTL